jgi:hypothetical protein
VLHPPHEAALRFETTTKHPNKIMKIRHLLLPASAVLVYGLVIPSLHADTFGTGVNSFAIDFTNIGNPGNTDDAGAGGGLYSSPYGGVPYEYRMAITEAAQDWVTKATAMGLANVTANAFMGDRPAGNMTWYEAAAFVNWLNTSTGHQAAYDLAFSGSWSMTLWSSDDAWQVGGENLYRHKDAYYFLPSEDEWYKAAYHQNDGVTANYWDYATGSNTIPPSVGGGTTPVTAVYNGVFGQPANVDDDGGLSPYGTRGQNGNVWEWQESAADGVNDSASEDRERRGGYWNGGEDTLRSSTRDSLPPEVTGDGVGFRVASVPEPASIVFLGGSALLLLRRRRAA